MLILPFLHFFGFIACLSLAIFVLYQDRRSLINWTCSLLMVCFSIWNFGDIIVHNPDSTISRETAEIMRNISSIGWICFSSVILCFSVVFSKRENLLRNKWFLFFVSLFPLVFIYRQWTIGLTLDPIRQYYGWSFAWRDSMWTYFFYFFYLVLSLQAILLIYLYGRKTKIANESLLILHIIFCGKKCKWFRRYKRKW